MSPFRVVAASLGFAALTACGRGSPATIEGELGARPDAGRDGRADAHADPVDHACAAITPLGVGCKAAPSCADRDKCGRPCVPACSPSCQRQHVHYSLWVTTYEVAGTEGLGRHQGLAVMGVDWAYDDRFRIETLAGAKAHAWPTGPTLSASMPIDMEQKMFHPGPHTAFAMCAAPRIILDRPLYNHGSTLSRADEQRESRMEIASTHADTLPLGAAAGQGRTVADLQAVGRCLDGVVDGYCDAVCGNCSYVLPAASVVDTRAGDWSEPSSKIFGPGGCGEEESYYGGVGQISRPTALGNKFPNPFTHCAYQGCKTRFYEAPTLNARLPFGEPLVSGRFGHNSNSDAEAAYRAFQRCGDPTAHTAADLCAPCGLADGPAKQNPCRDRTNTATNYWERTAKNTVGVFFDDVIPPIRDEKGGMKAPQPPMCAWASFRIEGM